MNVPSTIPSSALKAWPSLTGAKFVERVTSPVPADPDTIFDVYKAESGQLLTLVRTDYADPQDQASELRTISHQYRFKDLVKPYSETTAIAIQEHDDMEDGFFVTDDDVTHYRIYYYVANTTQYQARRSMSANLLAVSDALVEVRDIEGLDDLHEAIAELLHLNVSDEDAELLVPINEYIGVACDLLESGQDADSIKQSSARALLRNW
ncbi:hypothetical protein [Streptomyces sp. NPDC003688]